MTDDRLAQFIEMAIKREEDAYAFYMELLGKVSDESSEDTLRWIAGEAVTAEEWLGGVLILSAALIAIFQGEPAT